MISADASKNIIRHIGVKNIEKQDIKSIHFEQEQYVYNNKNNPDLDTKISKLKETIDNLDLNSKKIKELLLEIAKKMEELRIFNTDEICIKIKEFLHDEIKQKKISERWIEKCIPRKYVRRYEKKSEVYSVSRTNRQGKSLLQMNKPNDIGYQHTEESYNSKQRNNYAKSFGLESNGCSLCKDLIAENKELREIVEKNLTFFSAERLKNGIKVSKEMAEEITVQKNKCKQSLYIIFDLEGNIINIKADIDIDNESDKISNTPIH